MVRWGHSTPKGLTGDSRAKSRHRHLCLQALNRHIVGQTDRGRTESLMVRQRGAHAGGPSPPPIDSHRVHGLAWCAIAVTTLSILSAGATAEPQRKAVQQSAAESNAAAIDTVLVEAQRLRELERQISTFVSAITIHNQNDSLARWQAPICPLVAGLPFDKGKFVFQRVSQVASEAGIPLGSEDCTPNLLVVITREPEVLLRNWWRKQHRLFNQDRGVAGIERTIRTDAPVRVFYNACSVPPGLATTFAPRVLAQCGSGTLGSKLTRGAVRAIYSVIIVVDAEQVKALELEPLTDYIALISLAPTWALPLRSCVCLTISVQHDCKA